MEKNDKHENDEKGDVDLHTESDESGSKFYIYYMTFFATIGGLLFGYDTGIISGSMLLIEDYWQLSDLWKQSIVAATVGAAAVFALIAGFLSDLLGRKKVVMLASVIFTAGAAVMGSAPNKELLLLGRLIVGAGIGFASMSVPVYVAEAAPSDIRGRLVTINQLFITIGILISSIIAGLFSGDKVNGWRYMLGLAGVPSIIQFIGFLWLPESPRWLVEHGREKEAREALVQIRQTKHVDDEMKAILNNVATQKVLMKEAGSNVLVKMLTTQPVRKALFIGCGIQLFGQMSGINTVMFDGMLLYYSYYSASILKLAGFPVELAIWLVCIPNAVNCLATFIGIWLVEKAGRRILTLLSMIGVMIGLAVLAIGFQLSIEYTPHIRNGTEVMDTNTDCYAFNLCEDCISNDNCGFCYEKDDPETTGTCLPAFHDKPERYAYYEETDKDTNMTTVFNLRCNQTNVWETNRSQRKYFWADSFCPTDYSIMAVIGLALFVMGFAPGLGPMPWTINSEIYPMWARSTGNSLSTATNWVFNLIVSFTFLTFLDKIGKYGTFWMYCGITFLGFLFVFFLLPETKNKTLEEVQDLFMSKEYKEKMEKTKSENEKTETSSKF